MKRKHMSAVPAVLITLSSWSHVAQAGLPEWTSGHGDIGIAYHDGEWDLHIHSEGAVIGGVTYIDDEFDSGGVRIRVPEQMLTARPVDSGWNPIGVGAGSSFWLLPQTEVVGVPFVGIGTEEIAPGEFVGDSINLRLTGVTSPSGLGTFSVFQTDLFGQPNFFMSSADGIDLGDVLTLHAAGHIHVNFGFSEPGLWAITWEASGLHVSDGLVMGAATYYFNVIPEPSTAVLLMLSITAVFRRRVR
ncbi:MAG: choice-of-anchor M domain-containing protein [Phycisphaerae bacterium]|nr:choice-of-anchor M domain-containing protein [Phycisphaerae bacterium]